MVDQAVASAPDGIITPEAVVLDVRTAGFMPRIVAGVIDLAAMVVIVLVVSIVALAAFFGGDSTTTTIVSITVFAALFAYPILFETLWGGRTPGKAALGLRAVCADGSPVRSKDATLRAMRGIVDKVLPPGGVTGAWFVTFTPRHQRVGDLIAGTIVIRDPGRHVVSLALWFSPPPGLEAFGESIDPTAITVEQSTVVRSFLTRASTLPPEIRAAIARDLATRLAVTIRHPGSTGVAPESFLICAMARYQRRNGPGTSRVAAANPLVASASAAPGWAQ